MRENVKFDVALEIISSKIATAIKQKNKELAEELMNKREEIYLGNWDIIEEILKCK